MLCNMTTKCWSCGDLATKTPVLMASRRISTRAQAGFKDGFYIYLIGHLHMPFDFKDPCRTHQSFGMAQEEMSQICAQRVLQETTDW